MRQVGELLVVDLVQVRHFSPFRLEAVVQAPLPDRHAVLAAPLLLGVLEPVHIFISDGFATFANASPFEHMDLIFVFACGPALILVTVGGG